ncbi:hypothetical protein MBLNU457_7637t1 [Dothideomycetes sp. NU457]
MRIFLLPISTRRTLIYCEKQPPSSKTSYADWALNKASSTWADLEKADKGWKKSLVNLGNGIFRRIPFEEWGLKTLPSYSKSTVENAVMTKVLFPGRFLEEGKVTGLLARIATERQQMHKQRMVWSIVAMPFTIPVAILPVIPNIPLFYLAFRAWSHFKALNGGRYLEHLLDRKMITPTASPTLDQMYAAGLIHPAREVVRGAASPSETDTHEVAVKTLQQTNDDAEEVMLLRGWNGKLLAEKFELPEMEIEIERAVEQVEKSIKEGKEKAEQERNEKSRADAAPTEKR